MPPEPPRTDPRSTTPRPSPQAPNRARPRLGAPPDPCPAAVPPISTKKWVLNSFFDTWRMHAKFWPQLTWRNIKWGVCPYLPAHILIWAGPWTVALGKLRESASAQPLRFFMVMLVASVAPARSTRCASDAYSQGAAEGPGGSVIGAWGRSRWLGLHPRASPVRLFMPDCWFPGRTTTCHRKSYRTALPF